MSELREFRERGVSYYNYGEETCWDVGFSSIELDGGNFVILHKNSVKPFAYSQGQSMRWFKTKDTINPVDNLHNRGDVIRTYSVNTAHVDFNINIKFFYLNESEQYTEIPQGREHPNICTMMKSEKIKDKLLYFNETVAQTPAGCTIQGGKSKHKSYRRKRQQRRTKRRQQKTKRRQRK